MGMLMVSSQPPRQQISPFSLPTRNVEIMEKVPPKASPKGRFLGEQTTLHIHQAAKITSAISVTT